MKYNFDLIDLKGPEGYSSSLISTVRHWLTLEGAQQDVIDVFEEEALSSDHSHLVNICRQYTELANDLAYENGFIDESDCVID